MLSARSWSGRGGALRTKAKERVVGLGNGGSRLKTHWHQTDTPTRQVTLAGGTRLNQVPRHGQELPVANLTPPLKEIWGFVRLLD
ncbi:hypothetical protein PoB_000878100 [Plakobranchus ocellatus]|uniref:Uncharacterized protein n=1 Tax=Plakobranchus ocellatus TaxID=259542 RepID=A0AAV3YGH4_9GAST|nr:hypothetical protein PoB_000878100 [Plakobranchus ocellatus]